MFRIGESFSGHVFRSDVSDRPPKSIDREGLGESRRVTRPWKRQNVLNKIMKRRVFEIGSLRTGSQRGRKKNSAIESVIPWAKQVGAWIREGSECDAGESVDIVFDTPFRPLVISLLQISQVGN